MAYMSNNKLWESEFDGIVSKRDKLQDLNINQLKLEVHDTYKKKDEKLTTEVVYKQSFDAKSRRRAKKGSPSNTPYKPYFSEKTQDAKKNIKKQLYYVNGVHRNENLIF